MGRKNKPLTKLSLLELLHPKCSAGKCLVIGSNCPEILLPESGPEITAEADLIILAPTIEECRDNGWLEEAVHCLASSLSTDGVGYMLIPERWRLRVDKLVHNFGLLIHMPVGHFPDWATSMYLVPFTQPTVQYSFSNLISAVAWKQSVLKVWFHLPRAARLLEYLWPSTGLVVRHPGAPPVFEWLFGQDGEECRPGSAVIRRSWRGKNGTAVIYRFSEGDMQPSAVAKVNLASDSSSDPYPEVAALRRLGSRIQETGIQVPQLLLQQVEDGRRAPLQTFIAGRPAADVLRLQPERLTPTVKRLVRWLESWYRATVVRRPCSAGQWNGSLLEPAEQLAPLLAHGAEYQNWLAGRCRAAAGARMPQVDAHNDLTMANILLDDDGGMGIVDWETGKAQALPLVDFFYAITDAVRIACGWADRLDAFRACFAADGVYAPAVARLQARLAAVVNMPADMAELCFHACWLHHAANEHRSSHASEPPPFLRIVQWLALHKAEAGERRV